MSEDKLLGIVWSLGRGREEKGRKKIKNRSSLFLLFLFHLASLASNISEIFVLRKGQILTYSIWYPEIGGLPSICHRIWKNIVRKRHNQSKGMATTVVQWLLLSCYTFKWSQGLFCKWNIMASLMVALKLLRQLFILGIYRDATSFSQGNFPSSQNPDTTSFKPVKTPYSSLPCSTTSSKIWTVMTNVYCCLQQLEIWAWNILQLCTQSLELKVFGSAFWVSLTLSRMLSIQDITTWSVLESCLKF